MVRRRLRALEAGNGPAEEARGRARFLCPRITITAYFTWRLEAFFNKNCGNDHRVRAPKAVRLAVCATFVYHAGSDRRATLPRTWPRHCALRLPLRLRT